MTDTIYRNKAEKSTSEPPAFVSLTGLRDLPIFVYWKETPRGPQSKPTKIPRNPNHRGTDAASDDPSTWGTLADARKAAEIVKRKGKGGVGVMFTDLGDGTRIAGIDLDGCYDPMTGKAAPHATEIMERFAGAYAEVSPSGKGLKLYFRVKVEHVPLIRYAMGRTHDGKQRHGKTWTKGEKKEVALHLSNRYFAMTGIGFGQDPDTCRLVGVNDDLGVIGLAPIMWLIHMAGPDYKNGRPKDRDDSGSGALFRLARWIKSAGGTREDFEEAIEDDADAAAHVAANGERAIARAWERNPDPDPMGKDDLLEGFAINEDGVIRAYTARHSSELRFDHHAGKWFRYNGNYWKQEETKLALHFAHAASIELAEGEADSAAVRALKRVSTWEAVERAARSVREFAVTSHVWDRDKMLLGTPGGTVVLSTGALRPGNPDDFISKVTAVTPIPLRTFKPEIHCPLWLTFLDEALAGDGAAIRFLQQWGGYSLTGETKEQKLVFVYGPGGSGKGTAINTIGDILGDYGINVGMETLTASKHERHTTELARLRGARMARASETEKGKAWAENRIKTLTGQDVITARFMRQDDFEFMPEFKLTIFGNNRPSLKDVDAAIKRRFLILPFDHPPAYRDPELPEKLKVEWSAILSWLMVGCLDWQRNGLVIPPVMEEATAAYFEAEDTFAQWLADCCDVGSRFAEPTEMLWRSWQSYASALGEDPGSKRRTFPETLSQRGFEPIKDTAGIRGRGYRGLMLTEEARADAARFI